MQWKAISSVCVFLGETFSKKSLQYINVPFWYILQLYTYKLGLSAVLSFFSELSFTNTPNCSILWCKVSRSQFSTLIFSAGEKKEETRGKNSARLKREHYITRSVYYWLKPEVVRASAPTEKIKNEFMNTRVVRAFLWRAHGPHLKKILEIPRKMQVFKIYRLGSFFSGRATVQYCTPGE